MRGTAMAVSVLFLGGCASASPGVVQTAPAGVEALACAVSVLADQGYEPRELSSGILEAEVRHVSVPTGAVRELITVSLSDAAGTPEIRVNVSAVEYVPAEHGLPVQRQSAYQVRPSEAVVADGMRVLQLCGRHDEAMASVPR